MRGVPGGSGRLLFDGRTRAGDRARQTVLPDLVRGLRLLSPTQSVIVPEGPPPGSLQTGTILDPKQIGGQE